MLEDKDSIKKFYSWKPLCTELLPNKVATSIFAENRKFTIPELSKTPSVIDLLDNNLSLQINLTGYVYYYGGYASFTREIIKRLERKNHLIRLDPIPSGIDLDPFEFQYFKLLTQAPLDKEKQIINLLISSPRYYNPELIKDIDKKILWTMMETRQVHSEAIDRCFDFDEVWLPTSLDIERFGEDIDLRGSLKLVKFGIDFEKYDGELVSPMKLDNIDNKFVFMFCGNWNKRKGIDIIIRSFCKAFDGNRDVALVLFSKYATRPYGELKDYEQRWTIKHEFEKFTEDFRLSTMPQICIIDCAVHPNVVPSLMKRANCCVAASLGESLWLPGLEFGALKVPIIQTEWGGFRDYLNDENSFLINNKGFQVADEELVEGTSDYFKDQEFAIPDEDDLIDKMQYIYKNYNAAIIKAEKLYNFIQPNYDWKILIDKINSNLKEVANEPSI